MSGLLASTPDPPFFTTDINNEFLSRFKNPQVHAQVQVPAIEEYQVLTLFEFLEKLDKRTTGSTRRIDKNKRYQSIKVKNRRKMKDFLSQYLCKGKIGRSYGITAVERALDYDDYDVLIVANDDILDDVVSNSDSQGSVTSLMDSQNPEERAANLAEDLKHPAEYGDWLPQPAVPVGVLGTDGDMRYDTGDVDPDDSDDSQGSDDSRRPGSFIDIDIEDEAEDEEEVKAYDDWKRQLAEDDIMKDDSKERADAAHRPEPKGRNNSEKISYLKKQKDDSDAIREKKLRSVVGFLIVQKGECSSFPQDYAVNLICVRDGVADGVGPILIGLYLYTILERFRTRGHLQLGLLELAGGYHNISGLCLYSKFGFVPSMNLAVPGCFPSPGNMPMELHFPTKYPRPKTIENAKNIICSIVAGSNVAGLSFHPGFKLPLCNVPRGLKQIVLIALREYYRLFEYFTSGRIIKRTFIDYCNRKPELDLINSLLRTAFGSKVIGFGRNLMMDIELDVNLDANDNEFIRIISSVRPNTPNDLPQRNIGRCYTQGLIDYRNLFNGMFPTEAAAQAAAEVRPRLQQPGGGRIKKTKKRNKKTMKRNKKAAKQSKRKRKT